MFYNDENNHMARRMDPVDFYAGLKSLPFLSSLDLTGALAPLNGRMAQMSLNLLSLTHLSIEDADIFNLGMMSCIRAPLIEMMKLVHTGRTDGGTLAPITAAIYSILPAIPDSSAKFVLTATPGVLRAEGACHRWRPGSGGSGFHPLPIDYSASLPPLWIRLRLKNVVELRCDCLTDIALALWDDSHQQSQALPLPSLKKIALFASLRADRHADLVLRLKEELCTRTAAGAGVETVQLRRGFLEPVDVEELKAITHIVEISPLGGRSY
ncbi:hypothetical protein CCMSSC00406_0007760 [Pleurotus cornucopiae]|uniref:Uncharacterized protein n=1 Tax=Pleurotus cornucopiae TaxID=5321 RepID=A0ACB7J6W4_PLECO|nr:hypothetical protein CCMSSC00406_0007760 [Pleurotus cornucopiae]